MKTTEITTSILCLWLESREWTRSENIWIHAGERKTYTLADAVEREMLHEAQVKGTSVG